MTATVAEKGGYGERIAVLGSTTPRIFTPPLISGPAGPCGCGCALTPETSYGFDVEVFARDVVGEPLDPWERWLVIHAGELLPDGRPRFRNVLVLVARQNGKTHTLKILTLFWQFVECWSLILGTSTNLDYARESWEAATEIAESSPVLARVLAGRPRRANGEQTLTSWGPPLRPGGRPRKCRYKIAASNRRGGRSLSIDRLVLDELREHHDWSAWNASTNAMNARPYAQAYAITNQGDGESVVLHELRDACLDFIATGDGDWRFGLFEWSSPEGADCTDVEALAAANPNAGRRLDWDSILGPARRAKASGGEQEAGFRVEIMCQEAGALDPAVDPRAWDACLEPGTLDDVRSRLALCLDVSLDGKHATLAAAGRLEDGRARVEVVAAWSGPDCTARLRAELPEWIRKVKPRTIGWFPGGPAAELAADLKIDKDGPQRARLIPRHVTVKPFSEAPPVCMGFSEQVRVGAVVQSGDPLVDTQLRGTGKARNGDRWTFSRRGGRCDAVYAEAGAVYLARALPLKSVGSGIIRAGRRGSGDEQEKGR